MKRKARTWNYCWPDDPQPGLLHLEPPALSGEATFWIQCGGGTSEEQNKIADRIAALWNAAEELGLTTEAIEKGVMQMAFAHSHEQGWVIEVALARIKKLEAEKAESEHALGLAVETIEKLEAEKAEMREVIAKLLQVVELYEPASRHWKLILRAKTTIGREEE